MLGRVCSAGGTLPELKDKTLADDRPPRVPTQPGKWPCKRLLHRLHPSLRRQSGGQVTSRFGEKHCNNLCTALRTPSGSVSVKVRRLGHKWRWARSRSQRCLLPAVGRSAPSSRDGEMFVPLSSFVSGAALLTRRSVLYKTGSTGLQVRLMLVEVSYT